MSLVGDRIQAIRASLPESIELVAAAKSRSPEEVRAALEAGIRTIGHNYVQEAQAMIDQVGRDAATWTMIGHLQRNKVKAAVRLFDSVQTVDSLRLAEALDRECRRAGRVLPILIEVNAASEPQKSGVFPDDVVGLVRRVASLEAVRVVGLMTMGPPVDDPEQLRPVFRCVRTLFDELAQARITGVSMETLSMGMSDSYSVAAEEGATMVRLGTAIFGPRGA